MDMLKILQITLQGLVVKIHPSIDDAMKVGGNTADEILYACNTSTELSGYRWAYYKEK